MNRLTNKQKEIEMGLQFNPSIKDITTAGDVVQVADYVPQFGGCFMTVTEIKRDYVVGYIQAPPRTDVAIHTRLKWADVAFVGKASWVLETAVTGKLKDVVDAAKRVRETAATREVERTEKRRRTASRK